MFFDASFLDSKPACSLKFLEIAKYSRFLLSLALYMHTDMNRINEMKTEIFKKRYTREYPLMIIRRYGVDIMNILVFFSSPPLLLSSRVLFLRTELITLNGNS